VTGADDFERDEISDSVIDFTLGHLTGRERAALLAHLERCVSCRLEAQELTGVVDELLLLVPPVDPPAGFEDRVNRRLSARHAGRRWTTLAAAVVAGVAMVAVAFGVFRATSPGGPTRPAAGSAPATPGREVARTEALMVGRAASGDVVIMSGQPQWLFVSVQGTGWTRLVTCKITLARGGSITLGSFMVRSGGGSWGTALPVPVEEVDGVLLTDGRGSVLATALLAQVG
jgi:hypothetical protein